MSIWRITQKVKISIKEFFSFLRIWSHLMNKSLMENVIFWAVARVEHDRITSSEVYWEDCQTLSFFGGVLTVNYFRKKRQHRRLTDP